MIWAIESGSTSKTNTSVKGQYAVKDNFRESNSISPKDCFDWPPFRRLASVARRFRAVVFFGPPTPYGLISEHKLALKRNLLILVATLSCCVASQAQLHLNAGDVFIYEFRTLRPSPPFAQNSSPAIGLFNVLGGIQPGTEFRCDMLENNIADPVLCSASSGLQTNGNLAQCVRLGAWQDQQGVTRLTMIQGTAVIDRLQFFVQTPGSSEPIHTVFEYVAEAIFSVVPTYTLTISNNGLGSVSRPGGIFGGDPVIALSATPSNDWQFLNWTGDVTGNANPLNVAMTTNKFIIANFVQRPTILSQPQGLTAGVGDAATFSVAARGAQPLAYQWQFNGAPLAGATNETLTLTNVQPSQAGGYSVIATNRYGIATSETATLTVGANIVVVCDETGLRAAISRGRKVTFACDGTITLTNTITISTDTVLDGAGHSVVISGNNAVRLFNVSTGATFTALNLTLANGRHQGANGAAGMNGEPGFGGAIFNAGGTVNLVNCVLTNHAAVGGVAGADIFASSVRGGTGSGGAIYNQRGHLAITNSALWANQAQGGISTNPGAFLYGGDARGGAICNLDGIVSFVNVFISSNNAIGGAPITQLTPVDGSAFGGAVFTSGGRIFCSNSTFHANRALDSSPSFNGIPGSAYGGALCVSNSVVYLADGIFATNEAVAGRSGGGDGARGKGGAIYNQGLLQLREIRFDGNQADGGFNQLPGGSLGQGGALYTGSSAVIDACALTANIASGGIGGGFNEKNEGMGGAVYNEGICSATNSTFASNRAVGGTGFGISPWGGDGKGGGLYNDGGTFALTHVTLAANSADGGLGFPNGVGRGGGIFNTNGTVTLLSSIIANSLSGSNCFGVVTDGGGNISSDGSCNFSGPGSLNNTDPVLGPLGDYGGPTPTMPLLAGSPAIDRANIAFCPSTDQRGRARPFGSGCDIGAFESSPPYTIRGQMSGFAISGEIGGGILVESSTSFTRTDANGKYSLNGLNAGIYAVLLTMPGLIFVPELQVVTAGPDTVTIDFKAYRLNHLAVERLSNGIQHYVYAGTNGQAHEVHWSTNLIDWQTMATNVVDARNIFEFFVTNSASDRMHFFRTKKQQ